VPDGLVRQRPKNDKKYLPRAVKFAVRHKLIALCGVRFFTRKTACLEVEKMGNPAKACDVELTISTVNDEAPDH
jgi:hypothetical protein